MGMMREYLKDWSHALGRDMEALRFGDSGLALLVFPTSHARFYEWEDFGMIDALADKIEAGHIQLWCVDSLNSESWHAEWRHPRERVERHLDYERYLLEEVVPRMPWPPVLTGTSLGAFQAVLLALRHPTRVQGFVAMSGAYDSGKWLDGYSDDLTYHTNPLAFLQGLEDEAYLGPLRGMEKKVIATGADDANAQESIEAGELLRSKGVDVWLDVWPGWQHDWVYWREMIRRYV